MTTKQSSTLIATFTDNDGVLRARVRINGQPAIIEVSDAMRSALNPTDEERARRERIGATDAEIIAAQLDVDLTPNTGGARLRALLDRPVLFDDAGFLGAQDDYLRGEAAKQAAPVDPAPASQPDTQSVAPAAVDTGTQHGPTFPVEVPYSSDQPCACGRNLETTVVMTGGALCRYCQSRKAGGLTYGADYPHAQHLADGAAYRQSREQPTPAAVDTGAMHGPNTWIASPSTGAVVRVGDRYTNDSFYDGATAEVIAIDGWQLTYRVTYAEGHGEPRAWTIHAYSFLASYVAPRHARKITPTPAAIIAAAAQSLGRELSTRETCALFA